MPFNMPEDVNECPLCGEPYFGSIPDCDCEEIEEGLIYDDE